MNDVGPQVVHVVDDDDAIRDALAWLLRSRGLPARTWPSAEAFLAGHDPDQPGCLVLDIRMEGMSGVELFERLLDGNRALARGESETAAGIAQTKVGVQSLNEAAENLKAIA